MASSPRKDRLHEVTIQPTASIAAAIAQLDRAGTGALVLCSEGRRLRGLLTDGDVRRAILHSTPLESPCQTISTRKPVTANASVSAHEALRMMNEHDINHLPVVDAEGNLADLLLRRDLVPEQDLGMSAVIMAGGYGKRMLPLTERVPKPMLPVGNRPLLERTIEQLRRAGIHRVSLTTHYLSESILNHFGNGEAFGVQLHYVTEDRPLGTAGGLGRIENLKEPLLVINGDILTGVPFHEMLNYHRNLGAAVTIGVRKYEVQVPFGVVESDGFKVRRIREKPSLSFFINAGLYLLEPVFQKYLPPGERFDMTDLIERLVREGYLVVSFPILEYWLDVGRPEDYRKAQEDLANGSYQHNQ
jgi:dTDP-glucose pyrophosphorylase